MIRQVALLKCSYFRLLSVRRGGILTSETVKIAIDLLCALWTIIIPVLAAFVNSISLFLYRISNKKPMAFAIGFVFSMQKHRKNKKCAISSPLRGNRKRCTKNFMRWHLRIFVVRCSRMKFFAVFGQFRLRAASAPVQFRPRLRFRSRGSRARGTGASPGRSPARR